MLTDEERKRITQAVYNDKDRGHGYPVTSETLDEAMESIVRAARAQELRDTADAALIPPRPNQHMEETQAWATWLRDRAGTIENG